ncbi:Cpn60 TCP1 domain containing protein [Trichuris trichiura]|uniref:Cpn60 TCP1 domain containing protein n=1 Tax=Trichuris trichiura TaxID=36087 RepID=A0A077ZI01_TRITR|nr:Cpn60 TCP1 domain containing protein [Trichuris trichiura]
MIDRYFTFVINDEDAEACVLSPRNPSNDILIEMDRNLQDALHVVGNVFLNPKVLPGGDAKNEALDINGITGEMANRNKLNMRNLLTVRAQVHKTAIETPIMLLRVDKVLKVECRRRRTLINLSRINGI